MQSAIAGFQASIDRTLKEQAQQNELTVAKVRLAVVTAAVAAEWLVHFHSMAGFPPTPLGLAWFTTLWLVLALALALRLRAGWHRAWIPFVAPLLDGTLLIVEHVYASRTMVGNAMASEVLSVCYAITCSLLTAMGALRMTRVAALWSVGVGSVAFAAGLFLAAPTPIWLFALAALVAGMGSFSWWMTEIVRRAVQSELGKRTLRRFLPASVVEQAHRDPLPLLSEPRSVDATILVSDLRGFTSLSEALAPAEVLTLLNEIQGAFARTVESHGGTVDKFMGDGMLAVFGVMTPLEDHAGRAVATALALRETLREVNQAREMRDQRPLGMGIGVHSGPVIAGCLGGEDRLEFTVLGDAVNTASRLEALTKQMKIDVLVSGQTAQRLAGLDRLEPLGETPVRGKAATLRIFGLKRRELA